MMKLYSYYDRIYMNYKYLPLIPDSRDCLILEYKIVRYNVASYMTFKNNLMGWLRTLWSIIIIMLLDSKYKNVIYIFDEALTIFYILFIVLYHIFIVVFIISRH